MSTPGNHLNEINFTETLEPKWYNAFSGVDPSVFNKTYAQGRKHRAWTISLQRYQDFQMELVCGLRCKRLATSENFQFISVSPDVGLKFSIRGGSDIPHFRLDMTLKKIATDPPCDLVMSAIWTAFGEQGFKGNRQPTASPVQNTAYTFSSRLQNVKLSECILNKATATYCNGLEGEKGYFIEWTHSTAPYIIGFDIPKATIDAFSKSQKAAHYTFDRFRNAGMEVHIVTRVRQDLFDYWRHVTSMPDPTPGYYPNYDCRFVVEQRRFSPLNVPPPLEQSTIREQNQSRNRGWVNNPPGFAKPEVFISVNAPLTFINERQYEVFKVTGLLREATHQQANYSRHFNRTYSFDLWPSAFIHSTLGKEFSQYFYALLDPSATLRPMDAAAEQSPSLPTPGIQVRVKVSGLDTRCGGSQIVRTRTPFAPPNEWTGVVIETPKFPDTAKVPENAICVRLKRSDRIPSTGEILHITGSVIFGQPNPIFVQLRSAIRMAMYGNKDFGIPGNNNIKTLLLAKDNHTIRFHPNHGNLPTAARTLLQKLKELDVANTEQRAAIELALKPNTSYRDFFSLVTGPPGTGKTKVSMIVAVHCYREKRPVLVICGSNHGLDVLFRRINEKLKEGLPKSVLRVPGVYRLNTEFGEGSDTQNAPGVGRLTSVPVPEFTREMEQLKRVGINEEEFKLIQKSIQTSTASESSLGSYILSRLQLMAQNPKEIPEKELEILYSYTVYRKLLSDRGYLYTEPVELEPEDADELVRILISAERAAWLRLQELYVSQARIIFCTASTASRKSLRGFKPAIVIVDEASQLTEATCLNGIVKYYSSLEKVVLSGDAAQLPPTVTSFNRNEFYESDKLSLFERLLKTGVPGVALRTQYRMHPDISAFVNTTFYNDKLIDGPRVVRPDASLFSDHMQKTYKTSSGASFFLSVSGSTVWKRKNGSSVFNPEYITAIAALVSGLVNDQKCPQEDILILTYYSEELYVLKRFINQTLRFSGILIQSVDASQGNENSIVIVSTTRPGRDYGLGFVADLQRQCVALSRAKNGLVIVGNKMMVKSNKNSKVTCAWDDLVNHHRKCGRLIEVNGNRAALVAELDIPNAATYATFSPQANLAACLSALDNRVLHGLTVVVVPRDDMGPSCPICSKPVKASKINEHIDSGCEKFLDVSQSQSSPAEGSSQPQPSPSSAIPNFFQPTSSKKAAAQKSTERSNGVSNLQPSKAGTGKRPFSQEEPATPTLGSAALRVPASPSPFNSGNNDHSAKRPKPFNALQKSAPLAERMRPRTLDDVYGQELVGPNGVLRGLIERDRVPSMILWGSAGTGKTTVARVIASMVGSRFVEINSTSTGVAECKKLFAEARNELSLTGRKTIIFCDEIHRFTKAQQDVFLGPVENGQITLIGATTENPSFKVQNALLSRCRTFTLAKLTESDVCSILNRALSVEGPNYSPSEMVDDELIQYLAAFADGDARTALNLLELAMDLSQREDMTKEELKKSLTRTLVYDRAGDQHYDTISAFHKSIRGSDPDASLYYLARMIQSGEDPLYIARRLIVVASEDIGLADNSMLSLATAAYTAVEKIGLPEARINLAHATVAMALAPKSTRAYRGLANAMASLEEPGIAGLPIPIHLRNAPTRLMKEIGYGKEYKYNPDYKDGKVVQAYLPDKLTGKRFLEDLDLGTRIDPDLE
ncbi:uncharacterized protein GIQ15_04112 [Arthroderma uncinatum]|uniref:uncharacterized protein n=1 Tax=Arthroderma uncinatum TaxID=74035 RepID=UPI00144A83F3|nr:uncharacterized protein GIQ15_04112 [Arthroderma uncinatum]KAF3481353.1 hypothetical protein GIQ15_04112 [Arthroderma uncinatum]